MLCMADRISALFVAAIISVSWRWPGKPLTLLDAAPTGSRSQIINVVGNCRSLGIDRVRIRRGGARYFVDISIGLDVA